MTRRRRARPRARRRSCGLRRSCARSPPSGSRWGFMAERRTSIAVALVAGLLALALIGCGGEDQARVEPAAGEGSWRTLPPAPGAQRRRPQELTAQKVGDAVVVIAGVDRDATRVGGLRYDLAARRWRTLHAAPLRWRAGYAAAAAGDQVVVWGGTSDRGSHADGARYDAGADRWRRLAASPLGARYGHSAVSTGDEVLVFGGARELSGRSSRAGAVYAPASDRWRRIPRAPVQGRRGHVAVWTGEEMIVWGGYARERGGVPRGRFADGAAFDPARRAWRPIAGAPVRASEHALGAWLGDRLFVFDGSRAALYDPAADQWRLAAAPPLPEGAYEGAWTGERVLVWGAGRERGSRARGAAYDPARDAWTPLPAAPVRARGGHVALWTGQSLLVWGGCCRAGGVLVDGAEYFPGAGG